MYFSRAGGRYRPIKAIRTCLALLFIFGTTAIAAAQDPAEAWKALQQPAFDPSRTATAESVAITRDRIRITLTNGTIQLTKPVNGIVFGAAFHGTGRVQVDPPNPLEANTPFDLTLAFRPEKLSVNDNDDIESIVSEYGYVLDGTELAHLVEEVEELRSVTA